MIQPAPTPAPPLVIYGTGGHGEVVADAADAAGLALLGFLDDDPDAESPVGLPGRATRPLDADDPRLDHAAFIVAIGDNAARLRIHRRLADAGRTLVNVVHPAAVVSGRATLGRGVFVGAHAVVQARAVVGDAGMVNTAAVVEHHCRLGEAAHVAPGAVLGGNVRVGELTLLGLGSRVLPGVAVGERCVVGAGAVVTRDVAAGVTVVGNPARST